jgi:nitrilase
LAWQATRRHIAYEGRIFVVSCCQVQRRTDDLALSRFPPDAEWVMRGGTAIVSTTGDCDYLAGPVYEQEAILYADLDLADVIRAKHSFDVAGHYARADVLQLHVDRTAHPPLQEVRP